MSYNIDTFKLKSLKLVLPRGFSFAEFSDKFAREAMMIRGDAWTFNDNGEGLSMSGHLDKEYNLVVDKIDCFGEFSGSDYARLLKPLLEKFKGSIDASLVWEGGDKIERLVAKNGKITEKEIEI